MLRQFFSQLNRTEHDHQNQRALFIAFLFIGLGIFLATWPRNALGDIEFFGFLALFLISLFFAWRGELWPARVLMPLTGFMIVTHLVVIGGVYDEAVGGYYFIIIIAGLMLGQRALLTFGTMSVIAVVLIGIAEMNGWLITYFAILPNLRTVLTTAMFLLATTFALSFMIARLRYTLSIAQDSEVELKRSNTELRTLETQLEERIAQRTSELDFANHQLSEQLERINSLQARLRHEVIRDPLTGLFNRRHLDEMLPIELARAQRSNLPITIIMLDIDHFKKVNDSHGHPVGDTLLQAISELLKKNVRAGDIICRYGGEEFLLVLPGMRNGDARNRAEFLRNLIQDLIVPDGTFPIQVTASLGAAVYPDHARTAEDIISLADQALYRAKQNGRNRVEFAIGGKS